MNSYERLVAAVSFQKTDRVPVVPQIFGHAGVRAGCSLLEYIKSGEVAASCQRSAQQYYGYDAVFNVLDVCIEPELFGAEVHFNSSIYP